MKFSFDVVIIKGRTSKAAYAKSSTGSVGIDGLMMPNARDQRRRAVGAPLALVASGVTTSAERCIA
jgi:hypothetical protein